ncbi:hypothetical protein RFI_18478, partial [Reticulomyxa filosa]
TARSAHKSIQHQTNQEINVLRTLKSSRYVIDMIEHGQDRENNTMKIALEYMDGGSLKDYIQNHPRRPCPEGVVKYASYCVLQALKELHQHYYVHNDVKPGNILYSLGGDVKLSDFGTVMKLNPKTHDMLTINCGSAKYLAPEKTHNTTRVCYDMKADIWSFGLTIFELCTGELIHSDTTPTQLCSNPPQLDPHVFSADCCDFIRCCLIQDPKQRPSAEQLLQHIFLRNTNDNSKVSMGVMSPKMADLKFMIYALVEYYAKQIPVPINADVKDSIAKKRQSKELAAFGPFSPKDKDDDMQKILNMSAYCYCSWQDVQDRIVYVATVISNKMSKHY